MKSLRREWLLPVFLLLATVTVAYINHFRNEFHFDDAHAVSDNAYIRDIRNLGLFFTDTRTSSTLPPNRMYRPLVMTSLAIDYALAGGLKPPYFQTSTFLWFLLQVVLLFFLFRKILDFAKPNSWNVWTAFFAALLYGVHPAIAETVNYIIQRAEVLSTVGIVAALLMYVSWPDRRSTGWYLIPLLAALLSKPPAMIFPVLLFTYVLLFEEPQWSRALRRCVPALVVTILAALLIQAMTPDSFVPTETPGYAYRITQPMVALRYFRSFFFPFYLSADTDFNALPGIFDGGAWLGFVFVLALAGLACWLARRKEWRPTAFGLWWFLLAQIPTAAFSLAEVENDHRMYFPFVGLVIATVSAGKTWLTRTQPVPAARANAAAGICIGLCIAGIWGTWQRNEVWRTEESLWLDVTVKSPRNGRGLMNYGLTQMAKGDFRRALDYFEKAAVFTPAYYSLEINRGIANGGLNQDAAAEEHFRRALMLAPKLADGNFFYGRWLRERGRIPEAIAQLEQAIALNPDYLSARHLLMQIHATSQNWTRLKAAADESIQRFPADAVSAQYLAQASSGILAAPSGAAELTAPRTPEEYLDLSLAYHRAGRYQDCIDAARQALKLRPDYAEAYNNIAAAYEELHRWDEAVAAARRAVELKPDFQLAKNNLAWAESQKKIQDSGRPPK